MNKLRVGVVLTGGSRKEDGGGFSYYASLIRKIAAHTFCDEIEIVFVRFAPLPNGEKEDHTIVVDSSRFMRSLKFIPIRIFSFIARKSFLKVLGWHDDIFKWMTKQRNVQTALELIRQGVDILYFPTPTPSEINFPFIATHWDCGHRSTYAFPEMALHDEFEMREQYHRVTLQKAFAIFTESEESRNELHFYERINPDRIFVLPLFPGNVVHLFLSEEEHLAVMNKWALERNRYFFYPAQFWAHKNHYTLVQAFSRFSAENKGYKLVLSGSDRGNLQYIRRVTEELGLANSVVFCGFVTNEEIFALYSNAAALFMPTLLGPTNMPLLEAAALGCPVYCSDLKGHREMQVPGAKFFDPLDPSDISNKLAEAAANAGNDRKPASFGEDAMSILESNLLQVKTRRQLFENIYHY